MRTDVTIDKRQISCPNASTLGFGKYKAQVGDLVLFDECGKPQLGRMIGRVHYAPPLGETPAIRDYLLVVAIGDTLTHTFERWVNPKDVQQVVSISNQADVLGNFLGDAIIRAPIDEVRRAITDGYKTLADYRAYMEKREINLMDFEQRHPKGVCKCALCTVV